MEQKWYEKSFRRHLMDMHVEDWHEDFLRKLEPNGFVENLKKANAQSVMIYSQSHNGLAFYPTKIGKMHNAFQGREDVIKQTVDKCRAEGMDVVIYYSLIYNNYAYRQFPKWRVLTEEKKASREYNSRYGLCCPSNREYVEYVKAQLREVTEYFDFDGFFFDMTFWPWHCACDSCRARWEKEKGKPVPAANLDSEDFRDFNETYCRWMGEFAEEISNFVKSLRPSLTVTHNYANSVAGEWFQCSTEFVNEHCDYTSGDLYGGLRNHSFTVKYFHGVTKNPPCEYMIGKCDPDLKQHTVTKSESEMEKEMLLNVAHNAATLVIDAIDPDGGMDERAFRSIGKAFERTLPYEPYLDIHAKLLSDVGVVYSTLGKYSAYNDVYTHKNCSIGAMNALCAYHIPADVLTPFDIEKFSDHKCLALGLIDGVKKECIDALVRYVEQGGSLYFSGKDKGLLKAFLDGEYEGMTEHSYTYVAPNGKGEYFEYFNERYPFPVDGKMPKIKLARNEGVLATITTPYTLPEEEAFASIHSNPPGIRTALPAIVQRRIGKGKVIWSAAPIECDGRYVYRKMFCNLITELLAGKDITLQSDAPFDVELVLTRGEDYVQVSAVDFSYNEERRNVQSFRIAVKAAGVTKIVRVPDGEERAFTEEKGYVVFQSGDFNLNTTYRLQISK